MGKGKAQKQQAMGCQQQWPNISILDLCTTSHFTLPSTFDYTFSKDQQHYSTLYDLTGCRPLLQQ